MQGPQSLVSCHATCVVYRLAFPLKLGSMSRCLQQRAGADCDLCAAGDGAGGLGDREALPAGL